MENIKNYLMIPRQFFTLNNGTKTTVFYQIGTEGFTIWTYMLMRQSNQTSTEISIKRIQSFLNRTTGSKFKSEGLKDARTIKKYMVGIVVMGLIKIHDEIFENFETKALTEKHKIAKEFLEDVRANEELVVSVNNPITDEGFEIISTQLFEDYVNKIGHIGWSIYCLLYKYHNVSYGNQSSGNYGFANPSRKFIGQILNISERTVAKFISEGKMPKGLISIEQQPCITHFNAVLGVEEQKQEANHYKVWAKCDSENQYFINITPKDKAS